MRRKLAPIGILGVSLLAGLMMGAAAVTSKGADLRPDRAQDLAALARQEAGRVMAQREQLSKLQREIDALSQRQSSEVPTVSAELAQSAGLTALRGPAVRVTLTDAPTDYAPAGVNPDLLVVHQQDIQNVVNALWVAGAEAMTIQGQRVVADSAIKCVGNSVVLHGVPYAPPYQIVALGHPADLEAGLAADRNVQIYRQYAQLHQLGYAQTRIADAEFPAYQGRLNVSSARTA